MFQTVQPMLTTDLLLCKQLCRWRGSRWTPTRWGFRLLVVIKIRTVFISNKTLRGRARRVMMWFQSFPRSVESCIESSFINLVEKRGSKYYKTYFFCILETGTSERFLCALVRVLQQKEKNHFYCLSVFEVIYCGNNRNLTKKSLAFARFLI